MISPAAVAANAASVRERIRAAATRAGRDPGDVTLVAVTKVVGPEQVRALMAAGVAEIGENRSSELKAKLEALQDLERAATWDEPLQARTARWHFIGHLQTNKVRDVVGRAALIHSVDSEHLLAAIDVRAGRWGLVQDVLLEINVSGESTKSGLDPTGAEGLCRAAADYSNVQVRGLMTMAPLGEVEVTGPVFAEAKRLFDFLASRGYPRTRFDTLSMGMTNDFEVAVERGATCVRVGTALFA